MSNKFFFGNCFFGFLLFCSPVFSQLAGQRKIDSIIAVAFMNNPDTSAVKAFSELQRYHFNMGQFDSALYYCNLSIPVAQKVNNINRLSRIYYNTGLVYTNLTRYDSAKKYLDKAIKMAKENLDTPLLINCYNSNALLSNYQSDFKTAVQYMTRVASLIENSNNPDLLNFLPQTYGNIGHNLMAENQFEKGIAYEKKALLFRKYPDEQRYRVMLHLDIADAFIKLKKTAQAKLHLDTAKIGNDQLNNIQVESLVLNTEGFYFDAVNNLPASLAAYLKAYQIADSIASDYLKSEIADNVAKIYLKMNNDAMAEKYAITANNIAMRLHHLKVAASTFETLKKVAFAKGDFKKAFFLSEKEKLYSDSATNIETQKSAVYLEALYQNEKKENEIAALTLSNTSKELAVLKRNRLLLVGGLTASALLFMMGLLYRYSRQKRLIAEKDVMLQQEQVKFLERQQQIVSLQSMVNGQETERSRIAKDLHDGLGGLFSTIKMYFSTLQHEQTVLKGDPLFIKSYDLVNTASEEVRRIAHNMMPEVLIKIGLIQAVQELCNSISAGKLLKARLLTYGMEKRLNPSTEAMLFRIIQELLNNIIKHAKATEAIIQFNKEGNRLSIVVEDNGHGFNMQETAVNAKAGLASVQSRVNYLNGKLSIDSQKESGTTIMMDFLLNQA